MTKRTLVTLVILAGIACSVMLAVPVLMFVVSLGSMTDRSGDCGTGTPLEGGDVMPVSQSSGPGLNQDQRANAAIVISEGHRLGIPRRGIVIALAVAHQESRFLNYANDGMGDDLSFLQLNVGRSMSLPHQAIGSDHGSVGIFQQQWPWWGTLEELMDPREASRKFYTALLEVPGWESKTVTDAGQAVQNSAYPDAYADDEPLAEALLDDPRAAASAEVTTAALGDHRGETCLQGVARPGTVTFPLPTGSGYRDARNWGADSAHWSRGHTGTDFSVACGTPVLAATGGTVVVRTDQPWSGRWLVQVTTGVGRLTTWYGHMQSLDVTDGQTVEPGQQLGQVGSEGNSTGCHLHFEVHPRGGSIYEDNIDPTTWLRDNIGTDLDGDVEPVSADGGFTVATFNVLGHSHTRPGGNKPGWAPSHVRMAHTVALLEEYDVDVMGFQELQRTQARAFEAMAGSAYEVHHPPGETTENAIAWRRSRWSFVGAESVPIPYFEGRIKRMPVVRLRDRATNLDSIFVNVHNPASTKNHPHQGQHRAEALRRQVELVRTLHDRYEVPVFLTGDLNDRRDAFCRLTADSMMVASAGGSHDERCQPPPDAGIDWIMATVGTQFANHQRVRTATVRRASDHPLVISRVLSGSVS